MHLIMVRMDKFLLEMPVVCTNSAHMPVNYASNLVLNTKTKRQNVVVARGRLCNKPGSLQEAITGFIILINGIVNVSISPKVGQAIPSVKLSYVSVL